MKRGVLEFAGFSQPRSLLACVRSLVAVQTVFLTSFAAGIVETGLPYRQFGNADALSSAVAAVLVQPEADQPVHTFRMTRTTFSIQLRTHQQIDAAREGPSRAGPVVVSLVSTDGADLARAGRDGVAVQRGATLLNSGSVSLDIL